MKWLPITLLIVFGFIEVLLRLAMLAISFVFIIGLVITFEEPETAKQFLTPSCFDFAREIMNK